MQLTQDSHEKWAVSARRDSKPQHSAVYRQMLYQLSYQGSSAGWAKSHIQSNTTQGKASQPDIHIYIHVLNVFDLLGKAVVVLWVRSVDDYHSGWNPHLQDGDYCWSVG